MLLALEGDRRIDVHAGDVEAFRMACRNRHETIVKLLLTSSLDRLPPRDVYEEDYKGPESYEHWVWECQPKLRAMMSFRWAHQAWGRRELCWTCCHTGSPIELERSMIGYAVGKTCTLEDL